MISIKLAKEISIAKWGSELDLRNSDLIEKFRKEYPDLYRHHSCGFCFKYGFNFDTHGTDKLCLQCEISKSPAKMCIADDSLYSKIEICEYDEKQFLIKELIEIIKNIPEENE